MTTSQFYSPVQGHLDYLKFFAITNNFAVYEILAPVRGSLGIQLGEKWLNSIMFYFRHNTVEGLHCAIS